MGEPVLVGRALTKRYVMGEVEVVALHEVDFTLRAREIAVLLGPSGSGKSTLLNLLGGLDVPTSGALRHRDQVLFGPGVSMRPADVEARLTAFRRAHVGFVFQFYNLIPSLTARENVALVADIASSPLSPDAALAMVGLPARADHFPSQLSGGEQQRVAIARAIVKRPELLLCDEPTGALDAATGRRVLEVLMRVRDELGATIALVTHNAPIAEMGDRVVRLADGRVVSDEEVKAPKRPSEVSW